MQNDYYQDACACVARLRYQNDNPGIESEIDPGFDPAVSSMQKFLIALAEYSRVH